MSTWDTSGWVLNTAANVFDGCRALEEIIGIDRWDTANWRVTTIAAMFNYCLSLKRLDLGNWDTSGWPLTTLSSTFAYCRSLEEIKGLENWDTSNWALTTMAYMFQSCVSLRAVDISGWDTAGWNLTSIYLIMDGCNSLEVLKYPETMNMRNATNTNYVSSNTLTLADCNFYSCPISVYARGDYAPCLTRESLLSLVNKLPVIPAAKTLTLQQANRVKLAPEEIAIATQKGWTVA